MYSFLKPSYNSLLQEVRDNLDSFIADIKCIKDAYEFSEKALEDNLKKAEEAWHSFIDRCTHKDAEGKDVISMTEVQMNELQRLEKDRARTKRAFDLVPPSYFVSLISAYDSFFAGVVRCLYSICPEKLQESDIAFHYRDLIGLQSLTDAKKQIIDKQVETLLRDSHISQIEWLAKALNVSTLTSFDNWPVFVEITERRNLFVHTDGTVSSQYISVCKNYKACDSSIIEGSKISVDSDYFTKAFEVLYSFAVMLSQMILRVKYREKAGSSCIPDIDRILICNVLEMIEEKYYDVAIDVSEQVLSNRKFEHNSFERMYIVLNYAQAQKWSGDKDKCKEILCKEDWTSCSDEFLLLKNVLLDDYPQAYLHMKRLGKSNSHIKISSYKGWAIFQSLREEPKFKVVFREVFGEDYGEARTMDINQLEEKKEQLTSTTNLDEMTEKYQIHKEITIASAVPLQDEDMSQSGE